MSKGKDDGIGIGTEWLTTEDAAQLTGHTQEYMRQLALRDRVRAVKAGRDWLLNRASLLAFVRKMQALGSEKHNPWREDLEGRGRK
ncbi:MAG: helix-turn-helix domain-containing protein [Anaerolineales bacterium]